MNIFILDEDPELAARYHTDAHVVKMILESAQLLATAVRLVNGTKEVFNHAHTLRPQELYVLPGETYKLVLNKKGRSVYDYDIQLTYKLAHKNHPCAVWARATLGNWLWLKSLAAALNDEYKFRFDHTEDHKSYAVIQQLPLLALSDLTMTPFHQAIAPECKGPDAVVAYRMYYNTCKTHLFKWTKREKPFWACLP